MNKTEVKTGLLFILAALAANFLALALGLIGILLSPSHGQSMTGAASPASAEGALLSAAAILSLAGLALYLYGVIRASRGHYAFRTALYFALGGASAGLVASYLQSVGSVFSSLAALVSVGCDYLAIRSVLSACDDVSPFGLKKALLPVTVIYAIMLLITLASAIVELALSDMRTVNYLNLAVSVVSMAALAFCAAALIKARNRIK